MTKSRTNIKIIASDPGLITGVAVFQWVGDHRFFRSTELPAMAAVRYVHSLIGEMAGFLVVSERFTLSTGRSVMTPQLDAIEVNGALRYVVSASPYEQRFELQGRSDAKKALSVAEIRRLGWHKITKDNHANDAARHIGLAMLTHYPREYELLLSGIQST